MTSTTGDPQPQHDQGPTPLHPQDTGLSLRLEALNAAFSGLHIFPVYPINDGVCICPKGDSCDKPRGHPIAPGVVTEATNDLGTVGSWWKEWPNAAIGVATGRGTDFIVHDPRRTDAGRRSLEDLVRRYGPPVDDSESPLLVQTFSAWASEVDAAPNPGWLVEPVWPSDAYGVMAANPKPGRPGHNSTLPSRLPPAPSG